MEYTLSVFRNLFRRPTLLISLPGFGLIMPLLYIQLLLQIRSRESENDERCHDTSCPCFIPVSDTR
jgi:hypothetical protein